MKYLKISLLVILTAFYLKSNAQNIKVEAKLEKSSMMMGDQTVLHLIASLPIKDAIDFPSLIDTISSKVQIVKMGKTDTVADKSNPALHTITRNYTITSFDPGLQMVPSLTFKSKAGNFSTNALPLQVNAVKVDTTKGVYDIKEPLAVKYSWMDWIRDNGIVLGLGALAVLVLTALIWYFTKRRKVKPVVNIPEKPKVPAHQLALEKLHALNAQKLWQQDEMKRYYSELTDIIREYLEKRYQIHAMEQTTDEIFKSLKHRNILGIEKDKLKQILVLADLVKFAKEKPLSTDNEQSMDYAISFVKNTQETGAAKENKEEK